MDPGVIIQRLKKEVAELKAELAMVKGGEQKEHLTAEDIERCNLMVKDFIDSNEHKTLVMPDRLMINQCFYYFKTLYKNLEKKTGGPGVSGIPQDAKALTQNNFDESSKVVTKPDPAQEQEIQRLNLLVKQRDNEIGILLNYLNKKKEQGASGLNNSDMKVKRATDSYQKETEDPNSTSASI